MSLLAEVFNPRPKAAGSWPAWGPMDDRWYSTGNTLFGDGSGVEITPDTMLRCSTVWAAVRFRAFSWAMCPPSVFVQEGRKKREDYAHQVHQMLRFPNERDTGWQWRALNGVWMAVFGNAYNRIVRNARPGEPGQLQPIHPDLIRPWQQRSDGSMLYRYAPISGPVEFLGSEQVLHFKDMGLNGFAGAAMYQIIRNVVSIALLAEKHEETFLRKGTRVSGLLTTAGALTEDQRKDLRESVNADFGSGSATGSLGILPFGVDIKPLSLGARVEQRAELTDQNIGSILRFLGVPGVVIGWQGDKASTYASAEYFGGSAVTHCIMPILTNVEAEEDKALLVRGDGRYIKHNLDSLLRSNIKDRYEAFSKALGGAPFLSVNDVRETDDWDPDPDPRHDEIRIPTNLMPPANAGPEPFGAPPPKPGPAPAEDEAAGNVLPFPKAAETVTAPFVQMLPLAAPVASVTTVTWQPLAEKARAFAARGAVSVLRRERDAIIGKAPKFARDLPGWRAFLASSYADHAQYVAATMLVDDTAARSYCDGQAAAVLAGGVAVAETWDSEIAPRLVALALGEA